MMNPLYFIVLLVSGIVPLLYSTFVTDFIRDWKKFSISTSVIAIVFLIWDAIFTHLGVWGFTDEHCLGIYFFKMPLEEWLFFYVIPFCSLFTHFALFHAFPNLRLNKSVTLGLSIILIGISLVLVVTNFSKAYTAVNYSFLIIVLSLGITYQKKALQQFYISFLVILIPFFIVNGILTGAITETPIVWYDDLENLGIRLYTIPIEDIGYAFSMLFGNLLIFESLNKVKLPQS